jgi:hypothetical protein
MEVMIMKLAIENLIATLKHVSDELVLEEGHPKVDPFEYQLLVHDMGALTVRATGVLIKVKYAEVDA